MLLFHFGRNFESEGWTKDAQGNWIEVGPGGMPLNGGPRPPMMGRLGRIAKLRMVQPSLQARRSNRSGRMHATYSGYQA